MAKRKILIQLDCDEQASVFDAVVAVDAGVDQLLQYARVKPQGVRELVHGAMFTRGPRDLHQTAIFIGGGDVQVAQRVLQEVTQCFFGPMRVSVMLDPNGANTTAAAAVLTVAQHLKLAEVTASVLGATGPVGQRAVQLLARGGARVRVASRSIEKAQAVCQEMERRISGAALTPVKADSDEAILEALAGAEVVIAAGAAGVQLLSADVRRQCSSLRVAIDLNAVPPAGIEGIEPTDHGTEREGLICYGPIGVGGTKMKLHKAAIGKLFASNDQVLDAEQIYAIGQELQQTV